MNSNKLTLNIKNSDQIINSLTARNLELVMKIDKQLDAIDDVLEALNKMRITNIGQATKIDNLTRSNKKLSVQLTKNTTGE